MLPGNIIVLDLLMLLCLKDILFALPISPCMMGAALSNSTGSVLWSIVLIGAESCR